MQNAVGVEHLHRAASGKCDHVRLILATLLIESDGAFRFEWLALGDVGDRHDGVFDSASMADDERFIEDWMGAAHILVFADRDARW